MQPGLEALGAVQLQVDAADMLQMGATASAASASVGTPAADIFGRLMSRGIEDLNASVASAETAMSQLATGKGVELQDVMISLERARISVQAFVQVRNKLVESYQDLMRMQL